MFTRFWNWIWGKKPVPDIPRMYEFHKTTYGELFSEAMRIIVGKMPENANHFEIDKLRYGDCSMGASIEFNASGEGRVLPVKNGFGCLRISMQNLPVRAVVDTTKWHIRLTDKEKREFWPIDKLVKLAHQDGVNVPVGSTTLQELTKHMDAVPGNLESPPTPAVTGEPQTP